MESMLMSSADEVYVSTIWTMRECQKILQLAAIAPKSHVAWENIARFTKTLGLLARILPRSVDFSTRPRFC